MDFTDSSMYAFQIKRIWRTQLPHWEVERGVYFLTIRCAGSLPMAVSLKVEELARSLNAIEPASVEFVVWQRRYFAIMEKYLDSGLGFAPFKSDACCEALIASFQDLNDDGWDVRHYAIMPNHVHFVVWSDGGADMSRVWSHWKGKVALQLNRLLNRKGAFWQRDWFDRVMRSEAETERVIQYVQNNPVKANLPSEYRWVQ